MIGGLVTVAVGGALMIFLSTIEPGHNHWTIGLLPLFTGGALLVASRIVWPKDSK